jgi:hypothetical protein
MGEAKTLLPSREGGAQLRSDWEDEGPRCRKRKSRKLDSDPDLRCPRSPIARKLNPGPRAALAFQIPREVFDQILAWQKSAASAVALAR